MAIWGLGTEPSELVSSGSAGACKTLTRASLARGWRLSLAGAAAPALLLFLGSLALPDTPNSLLERGREEEAHRVLARVRTPPYPRYYLCLLWRCRTRPTACWSAGARRRRTACWRGCAPRPTLDTICACFVAAGHAQQPAGARARGGGAPRAGAGAHPALP